MENGKKWYKDGNKMVKNGNTQTDSKTVYKTANGHTYKHACAIIDNYSAMQMQEQLEHLSTSCVKA